MSYQELKLTEMSKNKNKIALLKEFKIHKRKEKISKY